MNVIYLVSFFKGGEVVFASENKDRAEKAAHTLSLIAAHQYKPAAKMCYDRMQYLRKIDEQDGEEFQSFQNVYTNVVSFLDFTGMHIEEIKLNHLSNLYELPEWILNCHMSHD